MREIYKESKINNFKYNDFYLYQIPIIKKVKLPKRVFDISPYIIGYTNGDKNLPEEYLFGSIVQRVELLKGLLAAKGYSDEKNRVIDYYTINKELKDSFIGLISSLGYLPNLYIEHKKDEQIIYHIKFFIDNSEYKRSELVDPIIYIEETNNYADMTCFYVDNDEHLFAAGKTWWITHNTRSLVGDACNMAYPVKYNSSLGYWIKEGNSEKVLFVATEQNFDEIQTLILAYLTDINEDKIITGNCSEEEKDRIKKAIYIMNEYKDNFLITRMPNPDITLIKAIIRQNYLVHDIQNVFYDYIFSSPSLLSEFRDLKIREDICLMLLSTALKDLAVELNIFVMTATQLNAEAEEKKGIKNQSCIRGSRAVIDKADVACITARCTQDELNILDRLIMSIGKAPNQVTDIYKVRRGRWTEVRVWSYMDLGTCRKTDLFITDGNLNNVPDFEIQFTNVEFEQDFSKIKEVLNIVNDENFSIAAIGKEPEKKKEWIDLI